MTPTEIVRIPNIVQASKVRVMRVTGWHSKLFLRLSFIVRPIPGLFSLLSGLVFSFHQPFVLGSNTSPFPLIEFGYPGLYRSV